MADTLLPQLQDPEAREAVAEAVTALLARWGVHEVNQARLLGLSSAVDLKRKITQTAGAETFERTGYLLAIDRALLKRYPYQPDKGDRWIFTGNEQLNGLTPLSLMLEKGVAGIIVVKKLAETGG